MLKRYALLAFMLFASIASFAQLGTGSIKGFVYDKSSGEPMIYTFVFLEGTTFGIQTDINGYFSLAKVPVGEYRLSTTQVGYDTVSASVVINNGQVVNQKLYLRSNAIRINEVKVSAKGVAKRTTVNTGVTTLTPADIKKLPSAGGEPDIAQFLQVTPGVVFTGDQGGQLYIRGGAPSQTGILLDGITIYNPFHTIGLYSVFETDAIRSADVHSAGFGAQYGNRTSAILDIHTKDGNKNRLSGKVSASPVMGRVMLEGPLVKAKSEDGTSVTFLLSLKHSYLDQTSTSFYSGLGDAFKNGLPYSFTDFFGKVSISGGSGSKLNVFGFNFDDKAKFLKPNSDISQADFNWKASGAGATFIVSPTGSSTLINGKFAYSEYKINYNAINQVPRSSGIKGFEAGIDFTNFFPGYTQFKYGVEVSGLQTTLDYRTALNHPITLDRNNTLAALFLSVRKNWSEKLIIEPSIRFQYYAALNKFSPEPRLGIKYNVSQNVRLKAATGLYSQTIVSTKSDRDIVNFFTGFLLSPDQTIQDENGETVKTNLQTAVHVLGGIEFDIAGVELNLEPWYKKFTRTIELNRTKQKATDPDYQAGTGEAYGIDLAAKYSKNRFYFWGVVSYQNVTNTYRVSSGERDANNNEILTKQTFPTPFDRRLNINLLGSYTLGKKKSVEISLRYNFGSPFPFTQTQGFYESVNMTSGGIGGNYPTQNGQIGLLYSNDINGGRLSNYHRVDFSAKKRFKLSTFSNLEASLNITNVANRNNIFYVDRVENARVYQLPFFPSVNATWNF
jgi:hypothetical protein